MTTSQEMDQQFASGDLERRLAELELFVGKMRDAGMDTLTESGYLQAGLNLPRMDKNGIQIQTPTPASGDVPGLYWVNGFSLDPDSEEPRVELAGRADPSTATFPNGIFTFRLKAISGERYGQFYHTVGATGSAELGMKLWHDSAAPAGLEPTFGISYAPATNTHKFNFANGTRVELSALPLVLGRIGSDPTIYNGGQVWFRTYTLKFRGNDGNTSLSFAFDGDGTEKTIASGVITITSPYHRVDTEGDAASDDLTTINGGTMGQFLTLRAENGARDVVVKDGTGNLQLEGDMTLNNVQDTITMIYDSNLTAWLEVARSNNGA
jgi:hypothetical protein